MSKHSQPYLFLVAAALAAATIACGGSASMTGADAPAAAAPAGRGATIQGTVLSGVAAGEVNASSLSGIRVSVVGTSLLVTTDGSGRFTLAGVPEGRVELRFEGQGLDARLAIEGLTPGQTLTLTVRVSGNSVSRADDDGDDDGDDNDDDDDDNGQQEVKFTGTISQLNPLLIGGRSVTTDGNTKYLGRKNETLLRSAVVKADNKVEVEGHQSGSSVLAKKIKLED